jgi:hypothetical protein
VLSAGKKSSADSEIKFLLAANMKALLLEEGFKRHAWTASGTA